MSRAEASVLLHKLGDTIEALRDLAQDAPVHVVEDRYKHIAAVDEARRELALTWGLSV